MTGSPSGAGAQARMPIRFPNGVDGHTHLIEAFGNAYTFTRRLEDVRAGTASFDRSSRIRR